MPHSFVRAVVLHELVKAQPQPACGTVNEVYLETDSADIVCASSENNLMHSRMTHEMPPGTFLAADDRFADSIKPSVFLVQSLATALDKRPIHNPDFSEVVRRNHVAWRHLVRIKREAPRAILRRRTLLERATHHRGLRPILANRHPEHGQGMYHLDTTTVYLH